MSKEKIPLLFILIYADKSSSHNYIIMLFDIYQNLIVKTKHIKSTTHSLTLSNIRAFDRIFNNYCLTKNTQIAFSKNILLTSPIWIYLSTVCRYIGAKMYNISFDTVTKRLYKIYPFLFKRKYKYTSSTKSLPLSILWENICKNNICPWITDKKTNEISYITQVNTRKIRLKKAYICLFFMFIRKHQSMQRRQYKSRTI